MSDRPVPVASRFLEWLLRYGVLVAALLSLLAFASGLLDGERNWASLLAAGLLLLSYGLSRRRKAKDAPGLTHPAPPATRD